MANSCDSRRPVHLLLVPLPAQGHLIPLLDLAHHISNRFAAAGAALSLTILVTPANLPLLNSFLSAVPSARPLVLPLLAHPFLYTGVEHVRDLPPMGSTFALGHALSLLGPDVLRWARSHPHPPSALLSDFFLGWANRLAVDLAIPHVVFYSSGAFAVSILDYLWPRMPRREDVDGPATLTSSPSFPFPQSSPSTASLASGRHSGPATRASSSCGRASLPTPPAAGGRPSTPSTT